MAKQLAYLPCMRCGKIAAVATSPRVSGFLRLAVENGVGEMDDGARAKLAEAADTGSAYGMLFGIPADIAARMLELECGACRQERERETL